MALFSRTQFILDEIIIIIKLYHQSRLNLLVVHLFFFLQQHFPLLKPYKNCIALILYLNKIYFTFILKVKFFVIGTTAPLKFHQ